MKVLRGIPAYYRLIGEDRGGQPLYFTLNLATNCSYRCAKCAEPGRTSIGTPLDAGEQGRMIALAANAGTKALVIIGAGEPTESFTQISRVISKAVENGMDTVMFSTLNGLTPDQAEFFLTHRTTIIVSLDSLKKDIYRRVTGGGELEKILSSLAILRRQFPVEQIGENRILRLGINTTVTNYNIQELMEIKAFAGDDIFYIANSPIKRGKFANELAWSAFVGDASLETLTKTAHAFSETGSHASVTDGVCGWFIRGIALDTDGALLSCGYAGDTSDGTRSSDIETPSDLIKLYEHSRQIYFSFAETLGYAPSCPLRDLSYRQFAENCRTQRK